MFRKLLDEGQAGENVGLLLLWHQALRTSSGGHGHHQAGLGHTHTEFEAQALQSCPGRGWPPHPFFNNYRPQFYFRTTDVTGVVTLPRAPRWSCRADNTEMTVNLIQPVAMEEGLKFAIREGVPHRWAPARSTKIVK
ncbi:hypothetical protein GCM10017687_70680 [Streptomyces echinatus]